MTIDKPRRAAGERDQFIPVRKSDLLDALIEHGSLTSEAERESFRRVCGFLAAIYHFEYFDELERLRHDYYYFNPELAPHGRLDRAALDAAYANLVTSFTAVLEAANFVEMSHVEIDRAHRERKAMRVEVDVPLHDFRDVRFFRRGRHDETIEAEAWLGLRKREHAVTVLDDVILFAALKPEAELDSQRAKQRLARRGMRPGSVLIKYFRNIPNKDLKALFPNFRVVMSTFDKLFLGVPALAGAVPILLNLASTVTVLFLVIGFYLGAVAVVEHDHIKTAFAAMSGLVALVAFVMRQWLRYQRQSLKYQKELTDNIYFRNINNNAGIFDYMIGAAEEQECKEAFLAYYFLRSEKLPPTQPELDRRIELWLADAFGIEVDFEVEDALVKLERLGLLRREGGHLRVLAPAPTLSRLDEVWDNYFQFEIASPATAADA
jgi:hypothetical protein